MNKIPLEIKILGVIVNTSAGSGYESVESSARRVIEKFKGCNIIRPDPGESREATMSAAQDLVAIVDAILVVGGDGTMSDVATSLFYAGASTPILGIGAGSTNASPLITLKASELDSLDPYALKLEEVGGILACVNGKKAGLGFNDVVLGDTILTTLNGHLVQVSAVEFMKGRKVQASPLKVGTSFSKVRIDRTGETILVHSGEFGQMFTAPLEKRYLGKGLAGGTSLAAALGLPAGIAITSQPLVNFSIGSEKLLAMEPIMTKTASLRVGDEVVVTGLFDGTCLNIDGNPLVLLRPDDEVRMHYVPGAVRSVKISYGL